MIIALIITNIILNVVFSLFMGVVLLRVAKESAQAKQIQNKYKNKK